jgi:hypothetical protein
LLVVGAVCCILLCLRCFQAPFGVLLLWQLQLEVGCNWGLHGIWGFGDGLQLQLDVVVAIFLFYTCGCGRFPHHNLSECALGCILSLGYFLVAVWLWLVAHSTFRMQIWRFGLF